MKSKNIAMKNIALITGIVALVAASAAPAQSTKAIPNFSAANLVLGRADFDGRAAGNGVRDFSTIGVGEVAIDATTRKVFVADGFRVLRFSNADALANGAAAEAVFGQGNFETNTTPDTPNENRFSAIGIHLDTQGRLWIADINNYRVLRFDNANTSGNFPAATRVYGQPDFTSKVQRFNASGMAGPTDESLILVTASGWQMPTTTGSSASIISRISLTVLRRTQYWGKRCSIPEALAGLKVSPNLKWICLMHWRYQAAGLYLFQSEITTESCVLIMRQV